MAQQVLIYRILPVAGLALVVAAVVRLISSSRLVPPPPRVRRIPTTFPLTATGWGTFTVDIRVRLKDGSVQSMCNRLRF